MTKLRVSLLFGGHSGEHESLYQFSTGDRENLDDAD
jgi:hypothetical protein